MFETFFSIYFEVIVGNILNLNFNGSIYLHIKVKKIFNIIGENFGNENTTEICNLIVYYIYKN